MSRASPLCRARLTYSFDIFLKLHSYGSGPARLGEIPPARSETYLAFNGFIHMNASSGPARLNRAGKDETTPFHVSRVNFKMKNK